VLARAGPWPAAISPAHRQHTGYWNGDLTGPARPGRQSAGRNDGGGLAQAPTRDRSGLVVEESVSCDVRLHGASLGGAILSGVTWLSTVCPGGTSSSDDGGACLGHLW